MAPLGTYSTRAVIDGTSQGSWGSSIQCPVSCKGTAYVATLPGPAITPNIPDGQALPFASPLAVTTPRGFLLHSISRQYIQLERRYGTDMFDIRQALLAGSASLLCHSAARPTSHKVRDASASGTSLSCLLIAFLDSRTWPKGFESGMCCFTWAMQSASAFADTITQQ